MDPDKPIFGRRLVYPNILPIDGAGTVVHLVSPLFSHHTWESQYRSRWSFDGSYITCKHVLDNEQLRLQFSIKVGEFIRPLVRKLDWTKWLQPFDTALTCFACIQRESIDLARRV